MKRLGAFVEATKAATPVVHFLTNYVTANDCANMTLAAGGTPIMSDSIQEVADLVDHASALVLNIGTLTERTIEAMLVAGKHANKIHCPVILDPVGAGSTRLRRETLMLFLKELNFSVIKGNSSEIKFLAEGITSSSGVDASKADIITERTLDSGVAFAQKMSLFAGSVIAITGPIDIIASAQDVYIVRNGHPFMAKVTGTGCMSGAVMASYVGANPHALLEASVAALCAMGICGEQAYAAMQAQLAGQAGQAQEAGQAGQVAGLGTYRSLLIDCMSRLDAATLDSQKNCTSLCQEESAWKTQQS